MIKRLQYLTIPVLMIWELPQLALGLVVFYIYKTRHTIVDIKRESHHIFIETNKIGLSLGWFVFWTPTGNRFQHLTNDCRMHEYGHARQSMILGPLYLLAVGIPSLARVLYSRWYYKKHGNSWKNYFDAYPENWADKLGGVTSPSIKTKNYPK